MVDINYTYLVMISKTNKPQKVTKYRPISLYKVIYKIIAEMLMTNRLKPILFIVVSQTKFAIVLERLITDNILAVYKTLHIMQTQLHGGQVYMALKLDINKAYGRFK